MARKPKAKTANALEAPPAARQPEPEFAENTLEPSRAPETPAPKRVRAKRPEVQAPPAATRAEDSARGSSPTQGDAASRVVPQAIRERFIGVGAEYFFPDGTPAFKDHGAKLTTPSENTEVIRSLVEIAQARGWNDITLRGTERFRKEAWFAASLAGIAVKGYEPSAFERERMVRAIARRRDGADAGARNDDGGARGEETRPRDAASRPPKARENPPDRVRNGEVHGARAAAADAQRETEATFSGRLVDHGAAPYKHDRKEGMSYFVRLETPTGDREVWGVDLERALKESLTQPSMGDSVTAKVVGREPVTVSVERYDDQGHFLGEEEVSTHRNVWVVERSEFLAHRAAVAKVFRDTAVTPEQGAKRHPELLGTYLQMQIAEKGAERDIAHPKDRQAFVDRAREALAQAIERGEPMEPVRMRERAPERTPPQPARQRDLDPRLR